MTKKEKTIARLQKKRDEFWRDFCRMPRRESFSGFYVAGQLDKVQQELDKLEGKKRSKRYRPQINIEVF
jgi:hypothetical protein